MVKKILVIKLGAKGDVIRTLPSLIAIKEKYSDSEISWITKPPSREILEMSPYINKILTIPLNLKEFLEEFDILLNFDIEEDATKLAEEIKAKEKYGFFSEGGYPAAFNFPAEYYLNTLFDDKLKKINTKTYQQMMFEAAELPYKKQHHPLYLTERNIKYAEDFVNKNNINTKKLIGIHMGASTRWPSKVWDLENIKEFIEKAKQRGCEILLFGGPDEIDIHEKFSKDLEEKGIKVYRNNPNNTLKEFASLVNLCTKMVCSDSTSLHVSLALKKPTIGLFFCTSPNEIEDYGLLKKIISPRLYDFFPEKMNEYDKELVKSISADEVLNALENSQKTKRVVNAIIKDNEKILIVKRNEGIHKKKWAFPGGVVEDNETLEEALRREIKEETNLELNQIIKKISDYSYSWENGERVLGKCYLVNVKKGDVKINEEAEEFRWVSLEELEQLDYVEGLYEEALSSFLD